MAPKPRKVQASRGFFLARIIHPMRRTVWTLLFALLLQLLAGSAWALRSERSSHPPATCHDAAVHQAAPTDTHHASGDTTHAATVQHDSHHCCAVGLVAGIPALLQPLPQAAPNSQHGPWASLSLRPDLRPPI